MSKRDLINAIGEFIAGALFAIVLITLAILPNLH
jgi:hypothetical protein